MFSKISVSLLLVASLLVLISHPGCKNDDNVQPDDDSIYQAQFDATKFLMSLDSLVVRISRNGNHPKVALSMALETIKSNIGVEFAVVYDSSNLFVRLSSGIGVVYNVIATDASGKALTRGGGGGGALTQQMSALSGACNNAMTNKKVLLFNAEFFTTPDAFDVLKRAKAAGVIDSYKELSLEQCDYKSLSTFKDYGLVVINTHGLPNGFQLGTSYKIPNITAGMEAFAETMRNDQDKLITDKINEGLFFISLNKKYEHTAPQLQEFIIKDADKIGIYVSGKHVSQLGLLNNTIVFGNFCYSGFNNTAIMEPTNIPIAQAFMSLQPITYYCYQTDFDQSRTVGDALAEEFEEYLYKGLFDKLEPTGTAHLDASGQEQKDPIYYKGLGWLRWVHMGHEDYCYNNCGIFIDGRDSQAYRTVCINGKTWFAENLRFESERSYIPNNDPSLLKVYGRLYKWEDLNGGLPFDTIPPGELQGLCPNNWHIPTREDIADLFPSMEYNNSGDFTNVQKVHTLETINGVRYKKNSTWTGLDPNTPKLNETGFSATASGYGYKSIGGEFIYEREGQETIFWVAGSFFLDQIEKEYFQEPGTIAFWSYPEGKVLIYGQHVGPDRYHSCRCVQD